MYNIGHDSSHSLRVQWLLFCMLDEEQSTFFVDVCVSSRHSQTSVDASSFLLCTWKIWYDVIDVTTLFRNLKLLFLFSSWHFRFFSVFFLAFSFFFFAIILIGFPSHFLDRHEMFSSHAKWRERRNRERKNPLNFGHCLWGHKNLLAGSFGTNSRNH